MASLSCLLVSHVAVSVKCSIERSHDTLVTSVMLTLVLSHVWYPKDSSMSWCLCCLFHSQVLINSIMYRIDDSSMCKIGNITSNSFNDVDLHHHPGGVYNISSIIKQSGQLSSRHVKCQKFHTTGDLPAGRLMVVHSRNGPITHCWLLFIDPRSNTQRDIYLVVWSLRSLHSNKNDRL